MTLRIALVTCATLPDLDADDRLLIQPLRALGVHAVPAVWDDAAVDWAAFDLVVLRSTWDYTARREQFVTWARSVNRLANPADVVDWNTDKRYLADLEAAGIPVVPTTWVADPAFSLSAQGTVVVKPSVGAGSVDAARFAMNDEHEARLAHEHASRVLAAGHTVMVQPYIDAIERNGETGVIFVGGEYSHAIRKGAMLRGKKRVESGGLFLEETIVEREPAQAELEIARRALDAVPGGPDRLLYARVDLVSDASGNPMLMELELTEPSLFMHASNGSEQRFARAIAAHATAVRT